MSSVKTQPFTAATNCGYSYHSIPHSCSKGDICHRMTPRITTARCTQMLPLAEKYRCSACSKLSMHVHQSFVGVTCRLAAYQWAGGVPAEGRRSRLDWEVFHLKGRLSEGDSGGEQLQIPFQGLPARMQTWASWQKAVSISCYLATAPPMKQLKQLLRRCWTHSSAEGQLGTVCAFMVLSAT